MQDEYITETKLSMMLKVSLDTVRRWRIDGVGPMFTKINRTVRYAMKDVDSFLNQRRRQSTKDE